TGRPAGARDRPRGPSLRAPLPAPGMVLDRRHPRREPHRRPRCGRVAPGWRGGGQPPGPAPVIRLAGLTVARAGKPLFTGASLVINPQERLALIGANGSGKSSLIEVLRGELSPEAGDVQMPSLRIGWLAQQPPRSRLTALRHVLAAD